MTQSNAQSNAQSFVADALHSIEQRTERRCDIALILGSGLTGIVDAVDDATRIQYRDIAGFPVSTAPSHAGELVLGTWRERQVALLNGRFHLYEGWQPADIALPVRTLRALGAKTLIVTNAAGALSPDFAPGDLMLIEDHMNFTGANPLLGANDEDAGPRFPDMSRAYDPELRQLALAHLADAGLALQCGIYAGVTGPSLETSAERRFYRMAGADAIGMSTVMEVIVAVHSGLRVLGFSAITNKATGGADQQPDTIEAVLANAHIAAKKIERALHVLLPKLP